MKALKIVLVIALSLVNLALALLLMTMGVMVKNGKAGFNSVLVVGAVFVVIVLVTVNIIRRLRKSIVGNNANEVRVTIGDYSYRYAGLYKRFIAGVIDTLIFLPLMCIWYIFENSHYYMFEISSWISNLSFLYALLLVGKYGKTIGKRIVGIEVKCINGTNASYWVSSKRVLIDIIISIMLIIVHLEFLITNDIILIPKMNFYDLNIYVSNRTHYWGLLMFMYVVWWLSEYFTLTFNRKKRAIHDYIAGTIVIDLSSQNDNNINEIPTMP